MTDLLQIGPDGLAHVNAKLKARLKPPPAQGNPPAPNGYTWGWNPGGGDGGGGSWGWVSPDSGGDGGGDGGGGSGGPPAQFPSPSEPGRRGSGLNPPAPPTVDLSHCTLAPGDTQGNREVWLVVKPPPKVEITVDGNRDGSITFDDLDKTTSEKPFMFWINDDRDANNVEGYTGVQGDLDPASGTPDCNDSIINGTRDLEDFQRLWIKVGSAVDPTDTAWEFRMRFVDVTDGAPAVNLWRAVKPGTEYLTDETTAQQQAGYTNPVMVNKDGESVIPRDLFDNADKRAAILFEGRSTGKGALVVRLYRNNQFVTEQKVYFQLKKLRDMYERWTVGDGDGNGQMPTALPDNPVGFQYTSSSPEENTMIVFVHGWNMAPFEKDAFAETAYKRLYWQGYKGRFAAFRWPTAYGFTAPLNYDWSERIAWNSATRFATLLQRFNAQYSGQVYVFGHSMGNVVAGEALRLYGRTNPAVRINSHVACQAALPASVYDPQANTNHALAFGFGTGPETPDIYPDWLAGTSAGVVRRFNFANENDNALADDKWERDQRLKPDDLTDFNYGYDGQNLNVVEDLFWKQASIFFPKEGLQLGDQATVWDRYEIMAYDAEPRSRALGTDLNSIADFAGQLRLGDIWTDPAGGDHPYSGGQWHSGEFRFDNMQQREFWRRLMVAFDLAQ